MKFRLRISPAWLLLALGLGCLFTPAPVFGEKPKASAPFNPAQIILEALELIEERALRPEPPSWEARAALRTYVRGLDSYSDYLSPAEYASFKVQQQKDYAGVGMYLLHGMNDSLVCLPLQDGPAHLVGVRASDQLLAVDDRTVAGQSPYVVAGWIIGPAGSKVSLTLKRQSLRLKLDIERQALNRKTVNYHSLSGHGALIRINAFRAGTASDLQKALDQAASARYLVLDLRGNPGGDFLEMLRAADLFFAADTPLLQLKGRRSSKLFKAKQRALPYPKRLLIWQDGATASAAEALIMMLDYHKKAISVGWPSFGKGSMQRVFTLGDGSALILTSGLIQDPAGLSYNGQGVKPMHLLPECAQDCTELFKRRTAQLTSYSVP